MRRPSSVAVLLRRVGSESRFGMGTRVAVPAPPARPAVALAQADARPEGPALASKLMIKSAIPVIAVSDSVRAEDYYCRVLGFQKMFAYRPDTSKPDPCYLGA